MIGVLLIDKPQGMTSFDVIRSVRTRFHVRGVGHAGTLDPAASGLLILLFGKATKVSTVLMNHDKSYEVTVHLGVETATYDIEGQVVATKDVNVSRDAFRAVLDGFLGRQLQKPPMYSARKFQGRKLYEYAREGQSVDVAPREIFIASIDLLSFEAPLARIRVSCSKGTYIRTLVHEIGAALDTGAYAENIRRIRSGTLHVEKAHALDEILSLESKEDLKRCLVSVDSVLAEMPHIQLNAELSKRARHGAGIRLAGDMAWKWSDHAPKNAASVLVLDEQDEPLALGAFDGVDRLQITRVF